MSFEWTALAYQENLVGNSAYFIFALAILLVYFALAGQYESWITPVAVILAVPLALTGHSGGAAELSDWPTISMCRSAWFCSSRFRPRTQS